MHSSISVPRQGQSRLHILWVQLCADMTPLAWTLYALWIALMIAMPHMLRWGGDHHFSLLMHSSILMQTILVGSVLSSRWRPAQILRAATIVAIGSWIVEVVGSSTGVPFGVYHYTDRLVPHVLGVPLLIPAAWWMMLVPAWGVARLLTERRGAAPFALAAGLAVTAWDLFLDPQMVAWGLWVWDQPDGYFGIPWSNFAGWIFTGTLLTMAVRPRYLPVAPLLLIYATTWLLESVGLAFFFGLPGPAAIGFLVMGALLVAALLRYRATSEVEQHDAPSVGPGLRP